MGEIIQMNFGDTGNNVGHQYLQKLIDDHYLNDQDDLISDQHRQKLHVSFEELRNQQYQFRGIFEDSNDLLTNKLLISPESRFINNDLILSNRNCNKSGTFSNCQNYFKDQIQDQLFERLSHHLERCDKMFGCNFVHATYDNSSGSSSQTINQFRERFPDKICSSFSLLPNVETTNTIEIYNFAFSLHQLIENCDFVMLFDYQAIENQLVKLKQLCTIDNCNNLIAECLLQLNCSQRFPGHQNADLRKISTNLIPFPRLHFMSCALSPFNIDSDWTSQLTNLSIPSNTYLTYHGVTRNLYFTQALITRCNTNNLDFHQILSTFNNKVEWIDDGSLQVNCKVENRALGKTVMHIGNHRDLGQTFKIHSEIFTANFRRKAFLHYYLQDGMDEMEFTEAESNFNDFVSEYFQCTCGMEDDYYEEYSEEGF